MAQLSLCRVGPSDIASLSRLLEADPIQNVYLRSELRLGLGAGSWWVVSGGGEFTAALLAGPLTVPWIPDPSDAHLLVPALERVGIPRMLVGPRQSALALHQAMRPARIPRDVRDPQPVLTVSRSTLRDTDGSTGLRPGTRADLDLLTVSAAAMHREEMGIDPLEVDADGWRVRMNHLVDRGWSWLWMEAGEIIFKAELSAWTSEVVQIQGVYTAPRWRGRGIARAALGQLCAELLLEVPLCSLYVNHYNVAARRLYERLGFRERGAFATVMY